MSLPSSRSLNRRQFLKIMGAAGAAALLTGCQADLPEPQAVAPGTTAAVKTRVAINRSDNYDPAVLRSKLAALLEQLDCLPSMVKPGAVIGIKTNLTGSAMWDDPRKPPAQELYITHPNFVEALGEILIDAGASRLVIMDGLTDEINFSAWGYEDIARRLGAELVNLCKPDPYADFANFPVGPQAEVYDQFQMNAILGEIDVMVSAAKLKCHATAGVTLSLKNLFGLVPMELYQTDADKSRRSAFHGNDDFDTRVPRVILDLNQARPVHLAVIDGIWTAEGGEGPWHDLKQVKPEIMLAGVDPVATDAVAAAVMGFDPCAPSGNRPFHHCDNYLELARQRGMGTNRLDEIEVLGESIEKVRYKFKLAR